MRSRPRGRCKAKLQRAEAALIARVLREMIDEGLPVYDRHTGGARPVGPGDVALLSRTWEPLDVYAEALSATGVPSVHAGGGNLSEPREAKDGLVLLRFIADPRDDLALIALLRSPFFAVDDRTLHELALERAGVSSWWESVKEASQESLSYPRGALEEVLSVRRLEPPGALMRLADRLTGYTAVLANLPGADRREADWRGFCELVSGLELGTEDIFSVVRSLRRLGEAGVEIPRPPLEAEDAVGLLTIHAAKGLEWPVVVLPDLARTILPSSDVVLFEPELGVAIDFSDEEDQKGVLYRVIADRRKRARESKARQVFYVAPTRARDHLILTSTDWGTKRFYGLTLLLPGLELAGTRCAQVEFRPQDARPPELPSPSPGIPPRLLLEQIG